MRRLLLITAILAVLPIAFAIAQTSTYGGPLVAVGAVANVNASTETFTIRTDRSFTYQVDARNARFGGPGILQLIHLEPGSQVNIYGSVLPSGIIRATFIDVRSVPSRFGTGVGDQPDASLTVPTLESPSSSFFRERADVLLSGTIRTVSGAYPDFRMTIRALGADYDVRTNRNTDFRDLDDLTSRTRDWLRVGDRVSVEGTLERDCRITARILLGEFGTAFRESIITRINRTPRTIEIRDSDGTRRTVLITGTTDIYEDGRRLDFDDLRVGDEVRVDVVRDSRGRLVAERIDVLLDRQPGRETVYGRVTDVDDADDLLWVNEDGRTVRIDARLAEIERDNRSIRLRDIRVGDTVRVYGDRTGTTVIANRIEVVTGTVDRGPFNAEGTIQSINRSARSFSIETRVLIPIRMTVETDRDTHFTRDARTISFEDLRVGDRVRVDGDLRGFSAVEATHVEVIR